AMYLANILVGLYLLDTYILGRAKQRSTGSDAAEQEIAPVLTLAGLSGAADVFGSAGSSRSAGSMGSAGGAGVADVPPPPVVPGTRPDRQDRAVVIMGAGPAGLTAAYELTRYRVPALVLEMDQRFVGGISRTEERWGYRFDIGGHRFFSKSQEIEDFWTEVAGDLLVTRGRLSRIYYRGKYF